MINVVRELAKRLRGILFSPSRAFVPTQSFLRFLVTQPRVFDIVSLLVQLRWLGGILRLAAQEPATDSTVAAAHNYNATKTTQKIFTSTRRAEPVYRIASTPTRQLKNDRLLIVGPRNVQEFLIAWMHGFSWKNIQAIDLYSTHPRIAVMDMHKIEYENDSFDVVTMVNTLGYSTDMDTAIRGVYRILSPGGRFCFTHAHWPESTTFEGDRVSGDEVIEICRKAGFRVFFHHNEAHVNALKGVQTSHYIGVEKPAATSKTR